MASTSTSCLTFPNSCKINEECNVLTGKCTQSPIPKTAECVLDVTKNGITKTYYGTYDTLHRLAANKEFRNSNLIFKTTDGELIYSFENDALKEVSKKKKKGKYPDTMFEQYKKSRGEEYKANTDCIGLLKNNKDKFFDGSYQGCIANMGRVLAPSTESQIGYIKEKYEYILKYFNTSKNDISAKSTTIYGDFETLLEVKDRLNLTDDNSEIVFNPLYIPQEQYENKYAKDIKKYEQIEKDGKIENILKPVKYYGLENNIEQLPEEGELFENMEQLPEEGELFENNQLPEVKIDLFETSQHKSKFDENIEDKYFFINQNRFIDISIGATDDEFENRAEQYKANALALLTEIEIEKAKKIEDKDSKVNKADASALLTEIEKAKQIEEKVKVSKIIITYTGIYDTGIKRSLEIFKKIRTEYFNQAQQALHPILPHSTQSSQHCYQKGADKCPEGTVCGAHTGKCVANPSHSTWLEINFNDARPPVKVYGSEKSLEKVERQVRENVGANAIITRGFETTGKGKGKSKGKEPAGVVEPVNTNITAKKKIQENEHSRLLGVMESIEGKTHRVDMNSNSLRDVAERLRKCIQQRK